MNTVLILAICAAIIIGFYLSARVDPEEELDALAGQELTMEILCERVQFEMDQQLEQDVTLLNLNKRNTERLQQNRNTLRKAIQTCKCGDRSAKEYVKDVIRDIIQKRIHITEQNIDQLLPFLQPEEFTPQQKFDILMFIYMRIHGDLALKKFIEKERFNEPKGTGSEMHYEITGADIVKVYPKYHRMFEELSFSDKLDIVTQYVYQAKFGLGALDVIRDLQIDGLSCGVSGIPSTFCLYGQDISFGASEYELPLTSSNSIWIFYKGIQMRLGCIGFGSEKELIRVVRNASSYDNPGTLSANRGCIINHMADGCRIVAVRPPFAESYGMFIRKVDAATFMSYETMYPDDKDLMLRDTMRWLVSGCQNIAITGTQGAGKSSLMMLLLGFIRSSFTLRVQELMTELRIRLLYPKRNIMSFVETDTVTAQTGLNVQKKTDGDVNVLGEVASADVASLAIQQGRVGSKQTMFTHHGKTAEAVVTSFRDDVVSSGYIPDVKIAEATVAQVLNFNIHLNKTPVGFRYLERITAIIPHVTEEYPADSEEIFKEFCFRMTDRKTFDTFDILRYIDGVYQPIEYIPDHIIAAMRDYFTPEENAEFDEFLIRFNARVAEYKAESGIPDFGHYVYEESTKAHIEGTAKSIKEAQKRDKQESTTTSSSSKSIAAFSPDALVQMTQMMAASLGALSSGRVAPTQIAGAVPFAAPVTVAQDPTLERVASDAIESSTAVSTVQTEGKSEQTEDAVVSYIKPLDSADTTDNKKKAEAKREAMRKSADTMEMQLMLRKAVSLQNAKMC